MVSEIRIYMEGAGAKDRNSSARLREGMRQFLGSLWQAGRSQNAVMRVIACGPRGDAYRLFQVALRDHPEAVNLLLVDSEGAVRGTPREHLSAVDRWDMRSIGDEQVHFMAQAMEGWFIADTDALASFYGHGFGAETLPRTQNVEQIPKDDLAPALKRATRRTTKGEYHKTHHAFDILARLDSGKVRRRAPHCDRLFRAIQAHLDSL